MSTPAIVRIQKIATDDDEHFEHTFAQLHQRFGAGLDPIRCATMRARADESANSRHINHAKAATEQPSARRPLAIRKPK